MSSWAKPGVKCVCINDEWSDIQCRLLGVEPPSRVPMINEVLTIKEVFSHTFERGLAAASFHELGHDFGFATVCFRPLTTGSQEQDVALFTHLLDGLAVRESA